MGGGRRGNGLVDDLFPTGSDPFLACPWHHSSAGGLVRGVLGAPRLLAGGVEGVHSVCVGPDPVLVVPSLGPHPVMRGGRGSVFFLTSVLFGDDSSAVVARGGVGELPSGVLLADDGVAMATFG
jgi:hypothetical protein